MAQKTQNTNEFIIVSTPKTKVMKNYIQTTL